jgi:hypothetical protein
VIAGPARPQVRLDQPGHRVTGRVIRACGPRARQPARVCATEMKHTPSGKSLPSTAGASAARRIFPAPPVQGRVSSRTCGSRREASCPAGRDGRTAATTCLSSSPLSCDSSPSRVRPAARAARIYRGGLHVHACPPGRRALARPASQACRISHLCHQNLRERHPLLGFDHRVVRWNFQRGDGTNPHHYTFSSDPRTVRDITAAFEIAWDRATPHAE